MNVDDPKMTAYALDELDEPERSIVAQATADSPELQRFVAETYELARFLRSQYRLELQRGLVAPGKLTAIKDDAFRSEAAPLAIAALIAVLAVVSAVMFSNNHSDVSRTSRSHVSGQSAEDRVRPDQFAPIEAEDAARASQVEADAGPYAFTGERPFVSVRSRPRSSVPLVVNSASYLDVRRSINAGMIPPRESVRIEGMLNYFAYEYPQPSAGEPYSLNLDVVTCPWDSKHRLVRVGLKAQQTIAVDADTGVEVEFNPRRIASYRLIGYDRKEPETQGLSQGKVASHSMAAGCTLTTLYEIVPLKLVALGNRAQIAGVTGAASEPVLTVKLQLKINGNDAAFKAMQRTASDIGSDFAAAPSELKFAAAVAEFGMILRDSEYKGNGSLQRVLEWAQQGKGADVNGYRADFIELVRKTQALKKS